MIYAVSEYAETAIDVLARRTRLAFLNVRAAEESLPRVIELMSRELGWSKQREQVQTETCDRGIDGSDDVDIDVKNDICGDNVMLQVFMWFMQKMQKSSQNVIQQCRNREVNHNFGT